MGIEATYTFQVNNYPFIVFVSSTHSCYLTSDHEEQGIPLCTATPLFQNETIAAIHFQGDQFVAGLFSPGFFAANETYANNLHCHYNVQCSPGKILYFNLVRESIQDAVDGDCVDFIKISRPSLNRELVTCGSDLEGFGGNEAGALSVKFSTDGAVGDCGFFLAAVCFDPATLNVPGCTVPNVTEARGKRGSYLPQSVIVSNV